MTLENWNDILFRFMSSAQN